MTRKRSTESDRVVSASGSAAAPARRKMAARPRGKHMSAEPGAAMPEISEPEAAAPEAISEVSVSEVIDAVIVEEASAAPYEPSREEIAELAYLYWEARGYRGGSAEQDWLRAEQELRARAQAVIV